MVDLTVLGGFWDKSRTHHSTPGPPGWGFGDGVSPFPEKCVNFRVLNKYNRHTILTGAGLTGLDGGVPNGDPNGLLFSLLISNK